MRFTFQIYADSSDELRAALLAAADAVPASTFANPKRGFKIEVDPDWFMTDALEVSDPVVQAAPTAVEEPAPAPVKAAKRAPAKPKAEAPSPPPPPESAPSAALKPKDAKEKALDILRDCYALENGPAAVKALQKELGVTKFVLVPDEKGIELLEKANALRSALGGPATVVVEPEPEVDTALELDADDDERELATADDGMGF